MAGEPRQFGPYRLVRRLGVGGMAETFEATRPAAGGFEQHVCLKRVLPAFSQDQVFVRRFQREAKLAARLRHTNIVGIIDAGVIEDAHYMALELVDGIDLRSLLRASPDERLAPDVVALIAMDLAYALQHAHTTLVHRDVSPSNILLSRTGDAKLADFGIAKAIEDAKITESRSAGGKIPYMAPEHMRGEPVDARADLFSLGVVMFEALAGVRPFDGAHDVETMQRILEGNRRSLAELAPEAPERVREVVERLTEVDVDARTQSASALLEQLGPVAPPPAARRRLAATIEAFRGGPETRLHVRAKEEERDTELTRVAGAKAERRPGRSRRSLILAAALGIGVIAIALASGNPETPASVLDPGSQPNTDTRANPVPAADADPVAAAAADADAGTDAAADTGADTDTAAGADADADAGAG